jgi:hypothetical protein
MKFRSRRLDRGKRRSYERQSHFDPFGRGEGAAMRRVAPVAA